jgi:1-acyl-sn-glycerol-3-phosphate acyltransferase
MALEAHVPVIPVAMIGTEKIQPPGRVMPKLGRVGVLIGKPLDFSRYEGMEGDRFVLRSITDEIMYELMNLSGQEYVDIYAAAAKASRKAGDKPPERGPLPPGPDPGDPAALPLPSGQMDEPGDAGAAPAAPAA